MQQPEKRNNSGTFWMLVPVMLLAGTVGGWWLMVSIAIDDPGFAVESDYYKKASNYDQVLEQRKENGRLGYRVTLSSFAVKGEAAKLLVRVEDKSGVSLPAAAVSLEAIPVARAFDVQNLPMVAAEDGNYRAVLKRPRLGLWELRLRVEHDGAVFTDVIRAELTANGGPPS